MLVYLAAALLSQTSLQSDQALGEIAPPMPLPGQVTACGTTTAYHTWDGTEIAPIADGSVITLTNLDTDDSITVCFVMDRAATVGDHTTVGTMVDVTDGVTTEEGACVILPKASQTSITFKARAMENVVSYRSGICEDPSSYDRAHEDLSIYPPCDADNDCDGIGGSGASKTCKTATADIESRLGKHGSKHGVRSAYLACRAAATANLHVYVGR